MTPVRKCITLILSRPRGEDSWFSVEWRKKLDAVKEKEHIPYIVFFGEVMMILDNTSHVVFESSCYNAGSVYGPDYDWTLSTMNLKMQREHRETLSDSWQRIEVISNSFVMEGFSQDFYMEWNGKFYPPVTVTFGGISEGHVEPVKNAANKIFYRPQFNVTDFSPVEKKQSELRMIELFVNYEKR